jgi:hypothetical protein
MWDVTLCAGGCRGYGKEAGVGGKGVAAWEFDRRRKKGGEEKNKRKRKEKKEEKKKRNRKRKRNRKMGKEIGKSLEKLGEFLRKLEEGCLWVFRFFGCQRDFRDGGDGEADRLAGPRRCGIPVVVADCGAGAARVGDGPGAGGAGGIRDTRAEGRESTGVSKGVR